MIVIIVEIKHTKVMGISKVLMRFPQLLNILQFLLSCILVISLRLYKEKPILK